jgi:hypothetical protein
LTVNICDGNVLSGVKAAKALDSYIRKLERGRSHDLTEKQIGVLLKTARVLRGAVSQSEKPAKKVKMNQTRIRRRRAVPR